MISIYIFWVIQTFKYSDTYIFDRNISELNIELMGIFKKILWVNLSEETFKEESVPEEIYRQYLGGYGLAVNLIYRYMPKKIVGGRENITSSRLAGNLCRRAFVTGISQLCE